MTLRPSRYTLGIVLHSIHFLVDTPYTQVNTCRARFTMALLARLAVACSLGVESTR